MKCIFTVQQITLFALLSNKYLNNKNLMIFINQLVKQ